MDTQTKNLACMLLQPLAVEIQDLAIPTIGDDDVLVQVEVTGLCGSDVCPKIFISVAHCQQYPAPQLLARWCRNEQANTPNCYRP